MKKMGTNHEPARFASLSYVAALLGLVLAVVLGPAGGVALAAPFAATAPGLGAAAGFSVLGKEGVTNSGPSVLSGNVGADSSITGFPPGSMGGTQVLAPAVNQAEADAMTAHHALMLQAGSAMPAGPNLTGVTLVPGVYDVGSALLPGVLTLNGPGVYIFMASDVTASGSISLINGASACDVFWHVESGAAIAGGAFVGTVIAGTSITFGNAATLDGRALALTGNVTLINNSIVGPSCGAGASTGPSYVGVEYECVDDGRVAVTVGLSAGVTVYGLGDDITSGQDMGENRIVRYLPLGRYAWRAAPPSGHYMQNAAEGVVDAADCSSAAIAAAALFPAAGATAQVLIPVSGVDRAEVKALASRQWMRIGLGALGLGFVLLGFTLRRKKAEAE